jgi:aspartyl/asparaginyl-tRNA synthetase
LVESKGAGQKFEIQVVKLETFDSDAEKFPIQTKNKPSLDYFVKCASKSPYQYVWRHYALCCSGFAIGVVIKKKDLYM